MVAALSGAQPHAIAAGASSDAVQDIAESASAVAAVWDTAAKQFAARANAASLPPPALTDVTLARAMPGADLRVQLVAWNKRYLFGRAWIDRPGEMARFVWVAEEKAVDGGVSLRVNVGLPGAYAGNGEPREECPFDIALKFSSDRVSGSFHTPGVEMEPLPIPSMSGLLKGTRSAMKDAIPAPPRLRPSKAPETAGSLARAGKCWSAAVGMLRLYRALDILMTQEVTRRNAWEAGRVIFPVLSPEGAVTPGSGAEPPDLAEMEVDLELEDELVIPSPAKPDPPVGAGADDPATRARLASIRDILERLRISAVAWAEALPSPHAASPGAGEAAADPDFGPWYGHGSLATNAVHANRLPDDASADGSPHWRFVRNWQIVGPFPASQPTLASWHLPEFLDVNDASYLTDTNAMKRHKETAIPDSQLVSWQRIQANVEEGLQRPWSPFARAHKSKIPKYAGPIDCRSYARTEIHSPKNVDLWVAVGADDYCRLWINDRLVAASVGPPDAPERVACGEASFRKGTNTMVARCDNMARYAQKDNRRPSRRALESHFWVKVAIRGRPLDAAASKARQAQVAAREATIRNLPADVQGYRNNNTAYYPDARPVTAWDRKTGMNVIWRAHLEFEAWGGPYGRNANSSKAPPVFMGDRLIQLCEPHFVLCLDKRTGKVLWERDCNVLEFTAPDKLEECRRLWREYAKVRADLMSRGANGAEREATLRKRGLSEEEVKAETARLGAAVREKGSAHRRGGPATFWKLMYDHGQFGRSAYGGWTGYSYGSPVTDGEHVWVKFGTGVAACFDRDGNRRWMTKIPAEGEYSVCPSPLLAGDTFIVEVGASSERPDQGRFSWEFTRLIGLDAVTGKERWRTPPLFRPTVTGSPVVMKVTNGREDVSVVVTEGAAVVRVDDGKVMHQPWLMDAGWGSPTVAGRDVFHAGGGLTASHPVMYDRDCIGLRPRWRRPLPCGFDGGLAFAGGRLYGSGGGQGAAGYVVFDTIERKLLRHEPPRPGEKVWRGMPPQVNGRQYVPTIAAGDYVFVGQHGSAFHGRIPDGSLCGVMQKRWDGLLVGQSHVERAWTSPPVFEGDRVYIRTDPSLLCLGYTGDEGRAYEADVNSLYIIGDLEAQPPADTPPVDIAPTEPEPRDKTAGFRRFVTYPIEVFGHFSTENADDVLAALGGPSGVAEGKVEEWPIEVAGEKIDKRHHRDCSMYGHSAVGGNTHFQDVEFGKGAYFHAWLVNERERVVRVWAQQEPPDIWIAGRRVPEGTRVRLKRGTYSLLARTYNTREWPAPKGFYFRFEESSDVEAERKAWHRELRASKPELERIARHGTRPAHVEKAKRLLALAPE